MTWRRSVGIAALAAVGIAAASLAQERFDYQVRGDMFRAFGGNEAAFKNAMSIIDAKLREDPDHAEALVWRGAARYWRAGQSFGAGNTANARVLADAAMADMDRAIALQPSNIAVLIPRATCSWPLRGISEILTGYGISPPAWLPISKPPWRSVSPFSISSASTIAVNICPASPKAGRWPASGTRPKATSGGFSSNFRTRPMRSAPQQSSPIGATDAPSIVRPVIRPAAGL